MTADLVPKFNGQDKTYTVTRWVQDVDDHAEIFAWSALQQLLVARRALTGTAALWLRAERPHKTWEDLKAALIKEFTDPLDTKTIHEMMSAKKKRSNESCLDFLLVMKELGRRGKMADYVAIRYIVDGIVDSETNKMMLYGVTTYSDLKEKFKIYETIKEKMKDTQGDGKRQPTAAETPRTHGDHQKKCYSCGGLKHISADCPHKHLGLKCFNCNKFGHISSSCSAAKNSEGNNTNHSRGRTGSTSADTKTNRGITTYYCNCERETERNLATGECGSPIGCSDGEQDGGELSDDDAADAVTMTK